MIYLWIEDKKSGFDFWKDLCGILYKDKVKVESKGNAGNLVKSVEKLIEKDVENLYYILFDNVADNPVSVQQLIKLKALVRKQSNIKLIEEYISLETSLLSFLNLVDYLDRQKDMSGLNVDIQARQFLLNYIDFDNSADYSSTREILEYCHKYNTKKRYTIESLASSILRNLTKDSGFEVNKGVIGPCWLSSCCAIDMYTNCKDKFSSEEKVKNLINNSLLKNVINKVVL